MINCESSLYKYRQTGKIKVLFCINSLTGGGAEKLLVDIMKRFDHNKYCVDILLFNRSGVYLTDIPREVWLLTLEDREYLTNVRYDVEIAFLEGSAVKYIARRESDARKIAWVHTDLHNHHWTKMFYKDDAEEEADYMRMDEIVFVSEDAKRQFNIIFPEMEVSQTVIYNLIDAGDIRSRANAFPVVKNKLTLCSVGRLTEVKGYPRLISIIDRLVHEDGLDFELWILGDGGQRPLLETLIKQYLLEDVVFLKGFQSNPYPYMKASDIFVLPSYSEGYPLALAEALCLDKSILVTKCTGSEEMSDNGLYCMLVKNDDESIYHGLKKMIEDESLRKEYAHKALLRSKIFDADRTMELIYGLLPNANINITMDLNERILNHIILSSATSRNPGLLDGKMGIILFLMHYAKTSDNEIYKEIADDILDELWNEINEASPVGMASGLCGVGWGIEYLVQNGFVEGDANEICEEIDKAVRLQKIHPEMDRSIGTGLEGILHYVMSRIGGNVIANRPIPFETSLLEDLYSITRNKKTGIFALFNRFFTGSQYEYRLNLADFIPTRVRIKKNLATNQLGLRGLTGYLFKQLT